MKTIFIIVILTCLTLRLPAQNLTLNSPNGNELWIPGANQPITWAYSGLPDSARVKLVLFKDGTGPANRLGNIVQNHPIGRGGSGVYFWSVGRYEGGTAPGCNRCYYVRVLTMDENHKDDGSAPFSIGTAGNRTDLVILNPRADDQWNQGDSYAITWRWDRSARGPNTVDIFLIREQYQKGHCVWVQQATIANAAANTGTYSWRVGEFTTAPNDNSFSGRWLCYETPRSESQFLFKISIRATPPNEAAVIADSGHFRIAPKKEENGKN